jgi:hypothetical protein
MPLATECLVIFFFPYREEEEEEHFLSERPSDPNGG